MALIARLHLDENDRRTAERYALGAKGRLDAAGAPMDVLIDNVSRSGCLIVSDLVLPRDTLAELTLPGLEPRIARLVRQDANRLGWAFLRPLTSTEVEIAKAASPLPQPAREDCPASVEKIPSRVPLRLRAYISLAMLDALSLLAAFAPVDLFRWLGVTGDAHGRTVLLLMPLYFLLALNGGAYTVGCLKDPRRSALRALRALAMAGVVFGLLLFYLHVSLSFSRVVLTCGVGIAGLLIAGSRLVFGRMMGRAQGWRFSSDLLILDDAIVFPSGGETVLLASQAGLNPSLDDPQQFDRLGQLIRHCDRVIVACPPARRAVWSAMLKGAGVKVELLSPEIDELRGLGIGRVGGQATLVTTVGPMAFHQRVQKRLFDIAVSAAALVLLAPVMVAVAIAIKLDSPGPVFFRQPRIGQGNRLFGMYKFRSMKVGKLDHTASQLTQKDDPRVTRVGDFLRRTSLDELPQLLNVLLGQMSVVGPRPHATGAKAGETLYWHVDPRYWHRHSVMPGMTGLAQVRGHRGTTFEHADLVNRLQADLEYLAGWSLAKDLGIVFRTVKVLLHPNAF